MEEKDLKNFALTEDEYSKLKDAQVVSLEELENFDFTKDDSLDIDKYHDIVSIWKASKEETDEKKEALKQMEAEDIIKEMSEKFLGKEFTEKYNQQKENLWAFLRKYDANLDIVKNMTEAEKNKIYDIAEFLFNDYQMTLNHLTFLFPLTLEEHRFLYSVLTSKLEYGQDEVFQMELLKDHFLDIFRNFKKKSVTEIDMETAINVNDLIILYHLFSKYKVKGTGTEYELFKGILRKIGERTKLYNAYTVIVQRFSSQFMVWGGSLTVDESAITGQVVQPNTTEPILKTEEPILKVVDEKTGEEK
jgi:hypothetical protein